MLQLIYRFITSVTLIFLFKSSVTGQIRLELIHDSVSLKIHLKSLNFKSFKNVDLKDSIRVSSIYINKIYYKIYKDKVIIVHDYNFRKQKIFLYEFDTHNLNKLGLFKLKIKKKNSNHNQIMKDGFKYIIFF